MCIEYHIQVNMYHVCAQGVDERMINGHYYYYYYYKTQRNNRAKTQGTPDLNGETYTIRFQFQLTQNLNEGSGPGGED